MRPPAVMPPRASTSSTASSGRAMSGLNTLPAGLEVSGIGQDEVAGRKGGDILIHVEALGEGDCHGEQHHRQAQGRAR